ncbi:cation diffusion facilitator family transporter [Marinivivus vitaminiproducens]|uniref:cation diffusion facilitator family transporter n=1 Tax=Marinivivus vitaminiproducens TaxID=3035935 RepID=UPI00279842F1|nr:cation diffusion facilitator family transporter [Geminicoccaceae bacterium SCSIO 64248]
MSDARLVWAVAVNVGLTVAQVVGGALSGSLALVADALHNLSDAASLGIALFARRISRRPADERMTFGYARAEVVAALINLTTLIVIGLYLVYEAVVRFFAPEPVAGWTVVIIAAIALVVDLATAALTYAMSRESLNIRAAFLHNVADALGSVAVIVVGTLIILFGWTVVDPIATLMIAGYVLYQGFTEIGRSVRILMSGAPPDLDVNEVADALAGVEGVRSAHHLHAWELDERRRSLEAHVVIDRADAGRMEEIKGAAKRLLDERFNVGHSTLEIEFAGAAASCAESEAVVSHEEPRPNAAFAPRKEHGS